MSSTRLDGIEAEYRYWLDLQMGIFLQSLGEHLDNLELEDESLKNALKNELKQAHQTVKEIEQEYEEVIKTIKKGDRLDQKLNSLRPPRSKQSELLNSIKHIAARIDTIKVEQLKKLILKRAMEMASEDMDSSRVSGTGPDRPPLKWYVEKAAKELQGETKNGSPNKKREE